MLLHFLLAASLQVAGESEYPSHEVLRLDGTVEAPVIDGVLDDAAWERCTPITDLRQVIPVAGAQPSEATEILLAVDEDHLYVGLRCFDSDPSRIRATQMARDANLDPTTASSCSSTPSTTAATPSGSRSAPPARSATP